MVDVQLSTSTLGSGGSGMVPAAADLVVAPDDTGSRLDLFLTRHMAQTSRSQIQKLIADGCVTVNARPVKKRMHLAAGDCIHIDSDAAREQAHPSMHSQDIPLDILYEDASIIVLNKPAGLVVHPGNGNRQGTLANALLFHTEDLSREFSGDRPGIVHRLDKETSGVMVTAKNVAVHAVLAAQFSAHSVDKSYIGICIGEPPAPAGTMDYPLVRSTRDPLRRTVNPAGKAARTDYAVRVSRSGVSVVDFTLFTGRTHQIRAHCSHANMPIVCDPLYGGGKERILQLQPLDRTFAYAVYKCFSRHALHAHELGFDHPVSGRRMSFTAALPEDFERAMALFPQIHGTRKGGLHRGDQP